MQYIILLLALLCPSTLWAATINITTANTYADIEAANCGDVVSVAPGTYHMRLYLHKTCPQNNPITIQSSTPGTKPVFDYTGIIGHWGDQIYLQAYFPGDYNAGDLDRGCWQIRDGGAGYTVDGITVQGCSSDVTNQAGGIRLGAGAPANYITIKNSLIQNNDTGIQGGGMTITVDTCEFNGNGWSSNDQEHSIYIYGGDNLTIKNSYFHDNIGLGQHFHLRAWTNYLQNNTFAHWAGYAGDIMTPQNAYYVGTPPTKQWLYLTGNVFYGKSNPGNLTKIVAIYNDSGGSYDAGIVANWNTWIDDTANAAVIQLRNDSFPSNALSLDFNNNIVQVGPDAPYHHNNYYPYFIASATMGSPATTVTGRNNFFQTGYQFNGIQDGTTDYGFPLLTGTIWGNDALFTNLSTGNLTLTSGSPAINAAYTSASPSPGYIYSWPTQAATARGSLVDDGAFEYADTTPPTVSSPTPSRTVLAWNASSQVISIQCADGGSGVQGGRYSASNVTYPSMGGTLTNTGGNTWSATISGLSPNISYSYYADCIDVAGNYNTSGTNISFSTAARYYGLGGHMVNPVDSGSGH